LIRPALINEDPDGVVRPKGPGISTVVGNAAEEEWHERWLRSTDGSFVFQTTELQVPSVPENPTDPIFINARVLNPAYDPTKPYVPRSLRPEWYLVGITGRVLILPGQQTSARWKFLKKYNDIYDEWLIR
jgi:hypothetical protein